MKTLGPRLLLFFSAAVLLAPRIAAAKKVTIEWDEIPGATAYELQVLRPDGRPVGAKPIQRIADSSWQGDLKYGVYTYQIRAVDKRSRPGFWSEALPLAVMPDTPVPKLPEDGAKFSFYHPNAKTVLTWDPIPGVEEYRVELERDGKAYLDKFVTGNQLDTGVLPSGKYSWKVRAVLKASKRSPANFEGRTWNGEASDTAGFAIERGNLILPEIIGPKSILPPSPSGQIDFSWKAVPGADAYEIRFIRTSGSGKPEEIAAAFEKARPIRAKSDSVTLKVPLGSYHWQVRALASLPPEMTQGSPSDATYAGPASQSTFKIDSNAVFVRGAGYVALSTMLAPYTYQIVSPLTGYGGSMSSTSMTVRASGEYWPWAQWGLGAAGELTTFAVNGTTFNRSSAELTAKYQANISRDRFGWYLAPKGGLEARQYVIVGPEFDDAGKPIGTKSVPVLSLGLSGGLDLRKQFSDRWSMGAKASYFLPLTVIGNSAGPVTKEASYRNVSFGIQGLYWATGNVGLSAGAYIEKRSLSFQPVTTSSPEQVFMDGAYFFGSVLYRFGG